MTKELSTTFDPAAIEAKWFSHWEENGSFRPARPDAQPFTIVNPPPNVTGSLHIGHALDNTLQDIVVRYERLRGKDALWVVGMDHAGHRHANGGRTPDGSRPGQAHQLQPRGIRAEGVGLESGKRRHNHKAAAPPWLFDGLEPRTVHYGRSFHQGRGEGVCRSAQGWPHLPRQAAGELGSEAEDRNFRSRSRNAGCEGQLLDLHLSAGSDGSGDIRVSTTRPETMLADMAVAVHPDDDRYKALVERGAKVKLPITGREIPIVFDEHADPELGSGAVKITPGHDFNDFDVGKRAGFAAADMLNMLDAEGRVCQVNNAAKIPDELVGMDRFDARTRVVVQC